MLQADRLTDNWYVTAADVAALTQVSPRAHHHHTHLQSALHTLTEDLLHALADAMLARQVGT